MKDQEKLMSKIAEQKFRQHLEEIETSQQRKARMQKEQCEEEFKRYNEQYLQSQGNQKTFKRDLNRQAEETQRALDQIEQSMS